MSSEEVGEARHGGNRRNELAGAEDKNDDSRRTMASRDARLGEDVDDDGAQLSACSPAREEVQDSGDVRGNRS